VRIEDVCRRYGLPNKVADILRNSGVRELYPPQAEAIRRGALDGKNLTLAIPTATGKTLIAELCMLKSVLNEGGRCLYIVPLRALASEKYDEFREKYGDLGVKVGIATGDYDKADPHLAKYDIIVATSEKVDSLLRHRAKWLADVVTVAVFDEVHLINDPGRGPTLEILIARLREVNPEVQILALSATIRNSGEIADWLSSELVASEWRPVPLKEGVYYRGKILFGDGSKHVLGVRGEEATARLAIETVQEGGQVLIFVGTRRSSQTEAKRIAEKVREFLSRDKLEKLEEVASSIEAALGEPTRTCRLLAECVRQGTAFHHAGLHYLQRKLVEDAFRDNLIKVVCATPTLAAGVNLPSRRTIIRDYQRYAPPFGMQPIPVLEYKQMSGRAGRPKYDKYGEAVLIAKSEAEKEVLLEEYVLAKPERITSKLASEPALRTHVLAAIASGYVKSLQGMLNFINRTFFAYQYSASRVESLIEKILDFLREEGMISEKGKWLSATKFGRQVSRLYIDPLSGVVLRDGLMRLRDREPSDLGLLHLICHTPDMEIQYLRKRDYSELESIVKSYGDEFLIQIPSEAEDPEEYEFFLAELKTARILQAWLEEVPEDRIHEHFGIGAGDIRRCVSTAEWLLYAGHELAKLFGIKKACSPLRELRQRVRHGIKRELLELVRLHGIGRVRARSLFNAGYRGLRELARASEAELMRVEHIGEDMARSIKRQLREGVV